MYIHWFGSYEKIVQASVNMVLELGAKKAIFIRNEFEMSRKSLTFFRTFLTMCNNYTNSSDNTQVMGISQ